MQASIFRSHGLAAQIAVAFLIVYAPHLHAAVIRPSLQESQASIVAASERDFDRLDNEAGLRSGGAFPFDYQHLVFFDLDEQGEPIAGADLWTAASVQAGRLRGVYEGGWNYSLNMTVTLYAADSVVARSETRNDYILGSRLDPNEPDGFPIQAMLRVPAGEYDYEIQIRDNNWEDNRSVNQIRGRVVIPESIITQPFISSVAIAADSAGTWNPSADLELQLNAARIIQKDARPYVYFEAYGLTPGSTYRGEVRLVSRWVSRGQGEEFRGTYQPFQMQYRGNVPADPSEPVRKLLRLDLSDTDPGHYEVQIRVRDLETGLVSEVRSARLKVRGADSVRRLVPVVDVTVDEP
ncbi:MAG: hypothetical protein E4H28_06220 [Gemmatimonadales bacterium]|nr:MAG: hypothetical protein E4H28_06220 [Gemmatimonadales bacterium]